MRGAVAAIVLALGVNTFSVADVRASTASRPEYPIHSYAALHGHDPITIDDVSAMLLSRDAIPEAEIGHAHPVVTAMASRLATVTQSTGPAGPARPAATRAEFWAQLRDGITVRGGASWYPGTRGYGGTAHVAMPAAQYLVRGTKSPMVRVCVGGRCRTVPVVDSCSCSWGTPDEMIIDLSLPLVHELGLDPSLGIYRVEVTLVTG